MTDCHDTTPPTTSHTGYGRFILFSWCSEFNNSFAALTNKVQIKHTGNSFFIHKESKHYPLLSKSVLVSRMAPRPGKSSYTGLRAVLGLITGQIRLTCQLKFCLMGSLQKGLASTETNSQWDYSRLVEMENVNGSSSEHAAAVAIELRVRVRKPGEALHVLRNDIYGVRSQVSIGVEVFTNTVGQAYLPSSPRKSPEWPSQWSRQKRKTQ